MDDNTELRDDGADAGESLHLNAARSPAEYAKYIGALVSRLTDIEEDLLRVDKHQRLHLRGQHVEGDGKYDARLRAVPVNRSLSQALREVRSLKKSLNRAVLKRHQHADKVRKLPWVRYHRAVKQGRPAIPPAQAIPVPPNTQQQNSGYNGGGHNEFWDERERYGRESA